MSEYFDPHDEKNKVAVEYFESKTWLVIENSTNARASIKKTLTNMGAKTANLFDASAIVEAKEVIDTQRPNYIITNKIVKGGDPLTLFDYHLKKMPDRLHSGFFVVTEENSLSEIAWALEYEMDGIICLPLNGATMTNTLLNGIKRKLTPTSYLKKVEEGRKNYIKGQFEPAIEQFSEALSLDANPYEAYAFIGQIYFEQKEIPKAVSSFEYALKHNPKYFKALSRLADLYYHEKNYKMAYEINLDIAKQYPTSPAKIPDLIRLSIINKKYEDMLNYYKIFQTIPSPDLQMQNYLSAGFAILGKYFVGQKDTTHALEALTTAFKYSNGKYEILKNITQSFIDLKKADVLLTLFEGVDLASWPKEVQALHFQALNLTSKDDGEVIQAGENLLKNNVIDIVIFRAMLDRSLRMKRSKRHIENLVFQAIKNFPDCADEFNQALEKVT